MGRELNEYQMHIEWKDPKELIPYQHNTKIHDGQNVSNIATSIKKYGWQSYLVITKGNIVIIGHGRRLAAIELGCKCPCKVIEDDLTDAEIRELRIADNKTNESPWDWTELERELEDLDFGDFDFGFYNDDDENKQTTTDKEIPIIEEYQIIIDCDNEIDMQEKYDTIREAGIECRISTL